MSYKVESVFLHEGLRCVVIMTDMGHRCGYVGVPKEHPLYGKCYSEESEYLLMNVLKNEELGKRSPLSLFAMAINKSGNARIDSYFDVHGGITYSGGKDDYPIESDLWWFGFDCAHAGDARDLSVVNDELRKIEERFPETGVVRSLEYCIDECKRLASQLSKIKLRITNGY